METKKHNRRSRIVITVVAICLCFVLADGNLPNTAQTRTETPGCMLLAALPHRRLAWENRERSASVTEAVCPNTIEAQAGFTLIEMSIVLVVIGLIVGGILTGQTLIYSANLRKVGTELYKLQTAVTTFREKYSCLPGDCANATTFFGADPSCPESNSTTVHGTCNGNGDGTINSNWQGGTDEQSYVFNQLGLSSLIAGSYTMGPWASGYNPKFTVGNNTPISALASGVGYLIFTVTPGNPATMAPNAPIGSLIIQIGATSNTGNDLDWLAGAGYNAIDSQALDTKLDDGYAATGQLVGGNSYAPSTYNTNQTCLTGNNYSTSRVSGCTLSFILKGQQPLRHGIAAARRAESGCLPAYSR